MVVLGVRWGSDGGDGLDDDGDRLGVGHGEVANPSSHEQNDLGKMRGVHAGTTRPIYI